MVRFRTAWNPVSRTGFRDRAMMLPTGWTVSRVDRVSEMLAETRTSTPWRRTALVTRVISSGVTAEEATNTQSAPDRRMASDTESTSSKAGNPSSRAVVCRVGT